MNLNNLSTNRVWKGSDLPLEPSALNCEGGDYTDKSTSATPLPPSIENSATSANRELATSPYSAITRKKRTLQEKLF